MVLLQSSQLNESLKIGNVKPNFILLYVIYISLNTAPIFTYTVAFISGFLFDMLSYSLTGMNSFTFTLLGFILNNFKERIFLENPVSLLFSTFTSTLIYYFIYFFLLNIFVNPVNFYNFVIKLGIPEAVYNSVVALVIFAIFRNIFSRR